MAAKTPVDQIDPKPKSKSKSKNWDIYEDVDVFVDVTVAKMQQMQKKRPTKNKTPPKEPLKGDALRRAIMGIWHVCFCGSQWRSVAYMMGISYNTLYSLFHRWTKRGLWEQLLGDLVQQWRAACGEEKRPRTLLIDSRSCRSSPTCGQRGIDGGKKIKGIKLHIAVDEEGFPDVGMAISTANIHDTNGIIPVLCALARQGFQGTVIGDSGYKGKRLAAIAKANGITVVASASGDGKTFIPDGIRWVVERSFAWLSRYRRLNTIFDRTDASLLAFVRIAFISILSRRIARSVSA
jgi:transposase